MYEVVMTQGEYEQFKTKARIKMLEKDITYETLSARTGYSISTIHHFFSQKNSRFVAAAIAKELGIK